MPSNALNGAHSSLVVFVIDDADVPQAGIQALGDVSDRELVA
jgi:hypothetical protein